MPAVIGATSFSTLGVVTPSDRTGDSLDDAVSPPAANRAPLTARPAARVVDPRRDDTVSIPVARGRVRRPPALDGDGDSERKSIGGRARARSTARRDGAERESSTGSDGAGEITTLVPAIPLAAGPATAEPEAAEPPSALATDALSVTTPIPALYDGDTDVHLDNGAPPPPRLAPAAPVTEPIRRIETDPIIARPATTVVPTPRIGTDLRTDDDASSRPVTSPILWRRRPRVRRVTRVVRHVDPWSVFKIALVFSAVIYGVCLTSGVLLWEVAQSTGTVDNVERFLESGGWETFEFKGGELYHHMWIGGLFAAAGLVGLAVLAATLFNLVTDLVGGVRVTVLEEEVVIHEQSRPGRWQAVRARLIPEGVPPSEQQPTEQQPTIE